MGAFVKADIFFFITTIAVVFVSAVLIVVLVYLIRILSDVLFLSRKAKDEGEKIIKDISVARETLEREGKETAKNFSSLRSEIRNFLAFIPGLFKMKRRSTKK